MFKVSVISLMQRETAHKNTPNSDECKIKFQLIFNLSILRYFFAPPLKGEEAPAD
jgi:hypothetical protein